MNFWTGIIIGLFVGANFGVIITGLLVASKQEQYSDIIEVGPYILDEQGIADVIPANASRSSVIHS